MIDLIDSESTKEQDVIKALDEYETLDYGDLLDYPEDVDGVLNLLDDNIKSDWEMVSSLKVVYGRWSKILIAVFFFNEDHDCETLYLNDEFDWEHEQEVYAKLEEEKDEPEILDWNNFRWGARMSVLLTILFYLLILLPPQHPNTLWSAAGIAVFFGSCYVLSGAVSSVKESYLEACNKPKTMIYRVTGNISILVIVLAATTSLMWSRMAGQTVVKDGGNIVITYKEELFDYERRDVVK